MKKIIIILAVIVLVGFGVYLFNKKSSSVMPVPPTQTPPTTSQNKPVDTTKTVIGTSVEKRDIVAYHYGTGTKEILFVGGIHGGYSWNTTLVAYELMDYLQTKANPNPIPEDVRITVIPVLNPDGLAKVVGNTERFTRADVSTSKDTIIAGRFNANNVDLNRNFDCKWKPKGVWIKTPVSGGASPFSEPESQAFKNYIEKNTPSAVVVWYSSAGGVFSSSCDGQVSRETKMLTNTYAAASGYKPYNSFDFYETTGDMVNWLAKKEIPAISVLLTTHQDTEWEKNRAGIEALLNALR